MIDISTALHDLELGCVDFTVQRITYRVSNGAQVPTVRSFSAKGCIHPGTPEMIQLLPEENRHEEFIAVYTDFALSTGENSGQANFTAPDRIVYGGQSWRLIRLKAWPEFSYYQGLAVLLREGE